MTRRRHTRLRMPMLVAVLLILVWPGRCPAVQVTAGSTNGYLGATVSLDVNVDPSDAVVGGVQFWLTYDTSALSAQAIDWNSDLDKHYVGHAETANDRAGTIRLTAAAEPGTVTTGRHWRLTFRIRAEAGIGQTAIAFHQTTGPVTGETFAVDAQAAPADLPLSAADGSININDAAPTMFQVVAVSTSRLDVAWNDVTSDESGYTLERTTGSGAGADPIDMVIDNTGAVFTGTWTASSHSPGYYGTDYRHDGNTGQGTKSARYDIALEQVRNCDVFMQYPENPNRASNVPVTISGAGATNTVLVNQQSNGGTWVSLGSHILGPGSFITIANTGANGYVIADAIRITAASAWTGIADLPADTTTYSDTNLPNASTFAYRLKSLFADFESRYVGPASATTGTPGDNDNDGLADSDDPDDDNDGMSDAWELTYGLDPLVASDSIDTDLDDHTDIEEFITGFNPTNRDDGLRISIAMLNGTARVSCDTVETDPDYYSADRYYCIEQKPNLLSTLWTVLPGASNTLGQGQCIIITNTPSAASRFYRARVWLK